MIIPVQSALTMPVWNPRRHGMGDDTTDAMLSSITDTLSTSVNLFGYDIPVWIVGAGVLVLFMWIGSPGSEYKQKAAKLRSEYSIGGRVKKRGKKLKKGFGVMFG